MAWTATKTVVVKDNGTLLVTVRYSDGLKAFEETYRNYGPPDSQWIENTAKAKLEQLDALDAVTVATGAVGAPTPPVVDAKREAFRRNLVKARRVADLVSLGVLAKTDAEVVALAAAIRADLAAYWGDV